MSKLVVDFEEDFEKEVAPEAHLDQYLDNIIPGIRQWGEDLRETKFYALPGGKPWLEIRDDVGFQEAVLHFFNEGGEYLQSVDGNVMRGRWRLLDQTNKIIIEQGGGGGGGGQQGSGGNRRHDGEGGSGGSGGSGGGAGGYSGGGSGGGGGDNQKQPSKSELYELAFLNAQFFILKKHGDQARKGRQKYLFMGYEGIVRGLTWKESVLLLSKEYESHWTSFNTVVAGAIILILIIALFSLL